MKVSLKACEIDVCFCILLDSIRSNILIGERFFFVANILRVHSFVVRCYDKVGQICVIYLFKNDPVCFKM